MQVGIRLWLDSGSHTFRGLRYARNLLATSIILACLFLIMVLYWKHYNFVLWERYGVHCATTVLDEILRTVATVMLQTFERILLR